MKRNFVKKLFSAVLIGAMTMSLVTGCGSSQSAEKKDASDKTTEKKAEVSLSSTNYEFEKEFFYSNYNENSNADEDRQDGIDTFEDNDIVFETVSYQELTNLFQQEGDYMILLGGSWCHRSRAAIDYINKYAKEYGINKIYQFDYNMDGVNTNTTIRTSNGTDGDTYNFLYGELCERYLTNVNDWVAFKPGNENAITWTNLQGQDVVTGRTQVPFIFIYNKDNTQDNSGNNATDGTTKFPIVYAFEEMVERDSEGVYPSLQEYEVDENGKQIREYMTDEYLGRLKVIFDFFKDNNMKQGEYTDADYVKDVFPGVFSDDEQINLHVINYLQLTWLMKQEGESLILFGGAWDDATTKNIKAVNDYAVKNDVTVYWFDPAIDGYVGENEYGYDRAPMIMDESSPLVSMYKDLADTYLVNLESDTQVDGAPALTLPCLMSYNKDAKGDDGFAAPITAYSNDESGIENVFETYAAATK